MLIMGMWLLRMGGQMQTLCGTRRALTGVLEETTWVTLLHLAKNIIIDLTFF